MKITLSVVEAILLFKSLYREGFVDNATPEMPKPEIKTLSGEEVHNEILSMCYANSVTLYINSIKMYQTEKPDYDEIADFLIPYEDEIVSIKEIQNTWYVNTL